MSGPRDRIKTLVDRVRNSETITDADRVHQSLELVSCEPGTELGLSHVMTSTKHRRRTRKSTYAELKSRWNIL